MECSAKTQVNFYLFTNSIRSMFFFFCFQQGLKDVFDVAIMTTLKNKSRRVNPDKRGCVLL